MWSGDDLVFEAALSALAFQLNQQTFPQIARADAGRIKALDERKDVLEVFLGNAGVERHLLRRGLKKSVIVDVADDQLRRFAIVAVEHRLVELSHEVLLERFLRRDRIEKELALFFRLLRAAAVATRLRHVIAPFLIELRQLIELLLEIVIRGGGGGFRLTPVLGLGRIGQFFQHRIGFHFLLNQIAQFEQRRLQNKQALLKLRGEDLLQRKILRLMHSLAGHLRSLPSVRSSGAIRGPDDSTIDGRLARLYPAEHDLLFNPTTCLFKMKHISLAVLLMLAAMLNSAAQAPDPKNEGERVLALVKDVQAQQAQIVANQNKIDAKLADVAEAIRIARLFSSRSR